MNVGTGPARASGGWVALSILGMAALLALSAAAASAPAPPGPRPLTNEDIVRLVMTGVSEASIRARIDERPVEFDLAPDMVQELRVAGVSPGLLEAMRRRQAAMPKPAALPAGPEPAPAPAGPSGTLEVIFNPPPAGSGPEAAGSRPRHPSEGSIFALRRLPRGVPREGGMEVGETTDLAMAILCTTGEHVPDHWDTKSPLANAPRHERLLFQPGASPDTVKGFDVLYLDLRPSYRVEVPEGDHNLLVAAAAKQAGSGTWRLLAAAAARVSVRAGRTTRITMQAKSRIRGSRMAGFGVDIEWKVVSAQTLEEPDTAAPAPQAAKGSVPP